MDDNAWLVPCTALLFAPNSLINETINTDLVDPSVGTSQDPSELCCPTLADLGGPWAWVVDRLHTTSLEIPCESWSALLSTNLLIDLSLQLLDVRKNWGKDKSLFGHQCLQTTLAIRNHLWLVPHVA